MAQIVHKVLFTWLILLLFLIFLNLKLDETVSWNWFLVLLPLYIFDVLLLVNVIIQMISHCKSDANRSRTDLSMPRKVVFLVWVCLMLVFKLLLCIKLDYANEEIALCYVCIPLWLMLITLIGDVIRGLVLHALHS